MQRKFDPEDWLRLVETYRVTTTFSAPDADPDGLQPARRRSRPATTARSMKRLIANAAPWSFALKQMYLADFPADSLWEVYGSTELGVDTVLAPEDQLRKPGSCGLPAPGHRDQALRRRRRRGHRAGRSRASCTCAAPAMFDTYYKAEDKYEEDRRGDFHTVGDIAYRDDEGYYYICDRKKDMIITGGHEHLPGRDRGRPRAAPGHLRRGRVRDPERGVGRGGARRRRPGARRRRPGSEADVIAFAREHLAGYKIPRSVSFIDELPRTGSGKVLKRQLRAPFWAGHQSQVG